MLFAFIDDSSEVFTQIPSMIKKLISHRETEIDCFQSADQLLDTQKINKYDAFFIDIDMPKINGFDLTVMIHQENPNAYIIYITGRDDLITHAFRYRPLGFVRKQRIDSELPFAIETLLKLIDKAEQKITITEIRANGGEQHEIAIDQILFIESRNHLLTIHLKNREYCIRDSLTRFLKSPIFKNFIFIDSGVVVNMEHVKLMNNTIVFENGTILYISRRKLPEVMKAYFNFTKKVLL